MSPEELYNLVYQSGRFQLFNEYFQLLFVAIFWLLEVPETDSHLREQRITELSDVAGKADLDDSSSLVRDLVEHPVLRNRLEKSNSYNRAALFKTLLSRLGDRRLGIASGRETPAWNDAFRRIIVYCLDTQAYSEYRQIYAEKDYLDDEAKQSLAENAREKFQALAKRPDYDRYDEYQWMLDTTSDFWNKGQDKSTEFGIRRRMRDVLQGLKGKGGKGKF